MTTAWKYIQKVFAVLTSIILLIFPSVVDAEQHTVDGGMTYVSRDVFMLDEALIRGQSVTTDGDYYYFSGTYSLVKAPVSDPGKAVVTNVIAIPSALLLKGSNHIGGICYSNGKIYAPIEDSAEYASPYIVIYDAQTLKAEKIYSLPVSVEIPGEGNRFLHMDGVPWCAVDEARGYLYTAEWSTAEYLNVFDLTDMSFVKTVELNMELDRIQGAAMYEGSLYLSADTKADGKEIFKLDPETGIVQLFATRNVGEGVEAESMTVWPMEDGTLFHVIDVFSSRIGAALRHYALAE